MARFTHLLAPDRALWQRFLDTYPGRYISLDYDVRVGSGRDPGPAFSDPMRSMALSLSQRRIDAIGLCSDRLEIVEITMNAGLTALGQLIAYPLLYAADFNPTLPVIPILVCQAMQPDMADIYTRMNITFFVNPTPGKTASGPLPGPMEGAQ